MELKDVSAEGATIVLQRDEVSFLCAAITETIHAVSEREFKLRTQETPARAQEIWDQLIDILDKIRDSAIKPE